MRKLIRFLAIPKRPKMMHFLLIFDHNRINFLILHFISLPIIRQIGEHQIEKSKEQQRLIRIPRQRKIYLQTRKDKGSHRRYTIKRRHYKYHDDLRLEEGIVKIVKMHVDMIRRD